MKLTFYGGAGSVTGSNYLLEITGTDNNGKLITNNGESDRPRYKSSVISYKYLVDCGLHQGGNYAEKENFEDFPYDPKSIRAVFITHAHIDHIGLLPKLIKNGFRGTIYSTPPTKDFAEFLLLDSEHILMKEAEREKKPPLYTTEDIDLLMQHWKGVPYHEPIVEASLTATFFDAGHVLGSAIVKIEWSEKGTPRTILFSGDLGNTPAPIVRETERLDSADYCTVESTYGDRVHEPLESRKEKFEDVIEETVNAGGTLLIPAFALERTQELLYEIDRLFEEGRVPRVPVFLDSPLAIKLTEVYRKYESYFNAAVKEIVRGGDDILNFPGLTLTLTTEQSKEINHVPPPKIIIAGAGMSHGGRILHHEQRYLSDPKNTVLFVGYQTKGSLGRAIQEGAKRVTIFGEEISVRARHISISGYSAHADQPRLLHWLHPLRATLKKAFVVQGEGEGSSVLAQKIRDELAVDAVIPKKGESFEL